MSNINKLTVGEIMEILKSLPLDMPVLYNNCEGGGYDSVTIIRVNDMYVLNERTSYYEAEFAEMTAGCGKEPAFKALLLS